MAVEWVAGSSWNQWPDAHGIGGRMPVESALTAGLLTFAGVLSIGEGHLFHRDSTVRFL